MKQLLFILWAGIMMTTANISQASEVTIKVVGIDIQRGGSMNVMIFGEKGFPKKHKEAVFFQTLESLQETMKFSFNLSMQEVAIKVWHDENRDGKVSKNWTGIYPKEGLGFSNGQSVGFTGPPRYKKSKLTRDQYKDGLTIPINYP